MGQVSNQSTPWQICWIELVPLYKHNSNGYQEPCPHQNHQRQVEPALDHPRVKETDKEKTKSL